MLGVENFESSLKEYSKFFFRVHKLYVCRSLKNLVAQFKKIEWLFVNLHPKQAYSTFLRSFQSQRRDSLRLLFPDNWLFNGSFGLQPDSTFQRIYAVQPQASKIKKGILIYLLTVFTKHLKTQIIKKILVL